MSNQMAVTKTRIERLLDERETVNNLHEDLVAHVESREDGKEFTEVEEKQRASYQTRMEEIDSEVVELHEVLKREEESAKTSKLVRAHLAGRENGVSLDAEGQTVYRTFAAYARDQLIVTNSKIAEAAGGPTVRDMANERLTRSPVHTLSSDVEGLLPPQHIAQIMDVIDKKRPVVAASRSVNLQRGRFTFPSITQRPEVLLQGTEKTEGGTANMQVEMSEVVAQTFIGGGNLSWQTINWSTPDALQLWFDLAGEAYARRTEGTACAILTSCGTANRLGTADRISTASDFDAWLGGVIGGFAAVYDNSGALADTLYVSPNMFFAAAGLTSASGAVLISQGGLTLNTLGGSLAGVRVVTSYGFGTNTAIVGDSSAFLVAETAGAPVELRAVEPAIGGLEVGVIGAFAAECVDDDRFAQVS